MRLSTAKLFKGANGSRRMFIEGLSAAACRVLRTLGATFRGVRDLLTQAVLCGSFLIVGFLAWETWSTEIVVNTITLPKELLDAGYSPSTLTREAILTIDDSLDKLRSDASSRNFGVPVPGLTECRYSSVLPVAEMDVLWMRGINRISADADLLTEGLPSATAIPPKLIAMIKRQLGSRIIEVHAHVLKEPNGYKLQLMVEGFNDHVETRDTHMEAASQISGTLSVLLAEVLHPAAAAYHRATVRSSSLDDDLYVAENVIQDDKATYLIQLKRMLLSLEADGKDKLEQAAAAFLIAEDLSQNYDSTLAGSMSGISTLIIEKARIRFERLLDEENGKDSSSNKKIIEAIERAKAVRSDTGFVTKIYLASVLVEAKRIDEAKFLLQQASEETSRDPNIPADVKISVSIAAAGFLFDSGDLDGAQKIVDHIKYSSIDYHKSAPEYAKAYYDALEALIAFRRGSEVPAIGLLDSPLPDEQPCIAFMLSRSLANSGIFKAEQVTSLPGRQLKKSLVKSLNTAFERIERVGVSSFDLFHARALFLGDTGDSRGAVEYHKKAREHPGEHTWSYLNEGWMQFRLGNHHEAERLFVRSLEGGAVLAAVDGYLRSISIQGRHRDFLREFNRFRVFYDKYSPEQRTYLAQMVARSLCETGEVATNETVSPLKLSELTSAELQHCIKN